MLAELHLYGPPAGPSITLAHAVASGALNGIAGSVTFAPWKDPDELRAGLASGTMGDTRQMPPYLADYYRGLFRVDNR